MDITNIFSVDSDFNICKSWLCGSTDGQTYSISDWFDKKLMRCPDGRDIGKYGDIVEGCFASPEWDEAIGYRHNYKVDDPKVDEEATAMVERLNRYIDRLNKKIEALEPRKEA